MAPSPSPPGFQGSLHTGCRMRLYSGAKDPVLPWARGAIDFDGVRNEANDNPTLLSVQTHKALGAAAGTWTATVKAPDGWGQKFASLMAQVVDDDWVDIVWTQHGRQVHGMRGQIETIQESWSFQADGAPARTYTLQGQDFGRVLDKTPIWFNHHTGENIAGQEIIRVFGNMRMVPGLPAAEGGAPNATVEKIIQGFLQTLTEKGRVGHVLPQSMGGLSGTFEGALVFADWDYNASPARTSVNIQILDSGAMTLWGLAQEWSDPLFCEMFTDLTPANEKVWRPDGEYTPYATLMALYFRHKPFPTLRDGKDSLWYRLPELIVPESWVAHRDLGRGGAQRYNAYFVTPNVILEAANFDLTLPLWDIDDIHKHGLRPMQVTSRYVVEAGKTVDALREQRELIRDFNVLNPYLTNGTIALTHLVPGARIGQRLRIPGRTPQQDKTFYMEQVSHSWEAGGDGKTAVVVTRGWTGTDDSYLSALKEAAARYVHSPRGPAQEKVAGEFDPVYQPDNALPWDVA